LQDFSSNSLSSNRRYSVEKTLEKVTSLSKITANKYDDTDVRIVILFAFVFAIVSIFAGFIELTE